jgi:hypothetical protein
MMLDLAKGVLKISPEVEVGNTFDFDRCKRGGKRKCVVILTGYEGEVYLFQNN